MTPSLVFTIDTEPDDQWAPRGPFTFANTRGLGALKSFFHERDLPATWMTSYSIARDEESARVLREARDEGDEIAGHLHGWETPPYLDVDATHKPFIYEYDADVRFAKHQSLVAAHEDAFGARPYSYRAGRWAVDELELAHLAQLGYGIDSSIPPGIDFRDRFGLRAAGPDFSKWRSEVPSVVLLPAAFLGHGPSPGLRPPSPRKRGEGPRIWEVPASIVPVDDQLIWIRPLKHPRELLVRATRALLERGATIVNVMFHSSEADRKSVV